MDSELNLLQRQQTKVVYGIDASSANKEQRTGVENYARHLLRAMKPRALGGGSSEIVNDLQANERVILYSPSVLADELDAPVSNWQPTVLNWLFERAWMKGRVSLEMLRRKPDVLFVPAQGLPMFAPKHTVTTVHDIVAARSPELVDPKTRRKLLHVTKHAIKHANRIICPSEFTKQELIEVYKVPSEAVFVTPLAADTTVYRPIPSEEIRPFLQRQRLGENFFLFVGRLEKKKNVSSLIRAFELFKADRGHGDPFELVLVGNLGFGAKELEQYLLHSPVRDQIRLLGYRSDAEVAALMNQATAFLFPSWYEGFGLPNLEAMACGTPLVTADIPPHREVCGDAAMFVSPKEPEAWGHAMKKIAHDGTLRDDLSAKGSERVKQFSWEKTAEQTWEVLRSLV
jgi:glycosyltransferase involved in cell wall biosynthesis